MASPVGEDNWLAYVEEESRRASDLEARVKVVELFKKAVQSETGSLKIWLAYCEWFWSLFTDCQSAEAGWPEEEQALGRELFSFDSALSLWSEGYDTIKFRVNDSHEFWNRWVSIEMAQLARTRTPVGVRRISHLFRDRLQIPHATWDDTSQRFSSFLSDYNNAAYESEFKEVTALAQPAKAAYDAREPFELRLRAAVRAADPEAEKSVMREYLDWEMVECKKAKRTPLAISLCLGLYARALTGIFTRDDDIWGNVVVFLNDQHIHVKDNATRQVMPHMLDVLQRATSHCPWSGLLWSRYILTAEEAGLSFSDVESIKHAATNTKALDKDGMVGVIDMYAAWCGFLKRTAMKPDADEDAVDIAEVGLLAALEDVQLWGQRLQKEAYTGDRNFRLERIRIQFLTEVKNNLDEARVQWKKMCEKPSLADNYDFWLQYYIWEMLVFSAKPKPRSPTPVPPDTRSLRVPSLATEVLAQAVQRRSVDWPERLFEVYVQHCNDYELPETLHQALNTVYRARKGVTKRRERENAEAAAYYAHVQEQAQQAQQASAAELGPGQDSSMADSPSAAKRKREATPGDAADHGNKRPRNADQNGHGDAEASQNKRDREHTSIIVTNLPSGVTILSLKKYFRDYGHVNFAEIKPDADGNASTAFIEFKSVEDAQSALLRDQKYFEQNQITVRPGGGLTLYVSNYPPAADDAYIRNLYKNCGEIFSIRWPSLKFNTHRRFCYVTFLEKAAADEGTKLDNKLLEGEFRLQSKISNPNQKKHRESAVAEGRELRIKYLDFAASEDDVRDLFGKYGKVTSVKVMKNMKGQSTGLAYAVFETKEQAAAAMELDKVKFKSQILQVEPTKESNYKPTATNKAARSSSTPSPAPDGDVPMTGETTDGVRPGNSGQGPTSSEIKERTMALLNVPDTINDARLRELVEKHGEIVKLVLRPDHQGAIIEFADAATMGKASLGLDGAEIAPGRKIRVGTVQELFKTRGEQKAEDGAGTSNKAKTLMPPPPSFRRPGAAGRGGRGGLKRGLGFVAAKKGEETARSEDQNKPKSNADFKAMFLKSTNADGPNGTADA